MIFAIVGPSGAGKDTLIAGAMKRRPDLRLIRRVITRPTEAGGEDFEGVTESEFQARLAAGHFALHWQAHGLRYGIPADLLSGPGDVVFNGSRAALAAALIAFPDLQVILVTAPQAVLAERLAQRGREDQRDIRARLTRADYALPDSISATVVINDSTISVGVTRLLAALQPVRA
ncbi:phosphonate metabolism protein/1,5-bisphosphokinase (PRPP-forming) PhnN [Paracoccus sp. 11-3]|uniref:Ribose 1,5-bisphosphate phosphokinase PhnN n=1 Tax=Paracoccus amoyensis TaxID=2760093 RepID=A0A926GH23_9RHOB|nr:phosphonate metabolism protein/1,5-bisphosphokinase (PRPP-forming) PhnN [Paracoccus amoyensis]MBC9246897.1 phosphonate metabolism protein/1,5-bisphosphokinase (PRPP-forming) PhnN [Paracoccus amoyensis]